jgi:hypothetical protein
MSHGPTVSIISQDIRLLHSSPRQSVNNTVSTEDNWYHLFVCFWYDCPHWSRASSFTRFLDHTEQRTTVGRTPLDEWSARHRDLYLTKHNTHNRLTSMPLVVFETKISAGERPQTYALDRAVTGTGTDATAWRKALWAAWYGPVLWMRIQNKTDTGNPEAP